MLQVHTCILSLKSQFANTLCTKISLAPNRKQFLPLSVHDFQDFFENNFPLQKANIYGLRIFTSNIVTKILGIAGKQLIFANANIFIF